MNGLSTLMEALVRPTRGPIARRALGVVATCRCLLMKALPKVWARAMVDVDTA
jgi:hypothetical protein